MKKTITLMVQGRKQKHEKKDRSEYGRHRNLIKREAKKNCLDNTVRKLKTNFIEEIKKNRTTELEKILENPK